MVERVLRFFRVVDIIEADVDRPLPEVSESIKSLAGQPTPRFPWKNHFTWMARQNGFTILGQSDMHPFRIDGILEPVGDQTHVTIRSSYNEYFAKFLLFVPVAFAFMLWFAFLSQRPTTEVDLPTVIKGASCFLGVAVLFPGVLLFVLGFLAGRSRPEDLSTVISELHG